MLKVKDCKVKTEKGEVSAIAIPEQIYPYDYNLAILNKNYRFWFDSSQGEIFASKGEWVNGQMKAVGKSEILHVAIKFD